MFCPGCSVQISDDLKFCKQCGANLIGVRQAMSSREGRFDWSKTWVAEMLMSEEERERRAGVTPEKKRQDELKAGVITSAVGLGVMIFLRYLMEAIAMQSSPSDAMILTRVWLAGLIPFLIGLALIFNSTVISKPPLPPARQETPPLPPAMPSVAQIEPPASSPITEHTTAHLMKDER